MKSTQAQAAAMIRAELKKNGIAAKVRSDCGSMMTSVDVDLVDPLPALKEQVKRFVSRFQYGSFDPMQDLYEVSNRDESIPQVTFATVNVRYSDELRQAAWEYARNYFGMDDEPELVTGATSWHADQWLDQVLNGEAGHFWSDRKPRVRAAA